MDKDGTRVGAARPYNLPPNLTAAGQHLGAPTSTMPTSVRDGHATGIFSEPTFQQPRILSRGALSTAESKRQQKSHTFHTADYTTNVFRPGTSAGAGTKKMEVKDVSYPAPDHYRAKSMAGAALHNESQAYRAAKFKFAKATDLRVNGLLDATRHARQHAGGQFQTLFAPKKTPLQTQLNS